MSERYLRFASTRLEAVQGSSLVRLNDRVQHWAFVGAIGLSAFLLFSLELLAGRLVLPVFGGAPAVWTTSLCFFTGVLFLGYVYAHVVAARMPFAVAGVVQLGLAVAVVAVAIVAPTHLASLRLSGLPASLNVLLVLAVIAGGPAFLLATTTPLLSAWYAGRGNDPWWLFAVSNGASFLALLAYPLLIEPSIGLSAQRGLLAVALAAYAASLVPIVLGARQAAVPAQRSSDRSLASLGARRQAIWLLAALVPAGLLSATTNFLQTDLISAPLIWIGPLAIYLASFVVAFAQRGRPVVRACGWLVPGAATLLWLPFIKPEGWPSSPLLAVELGAFFVLAVAIHSGLAGDRPDTRLLTRFYLIVTAGGAVGTAFVALVAPLVFSTVYEYPILIVAGLVVLALLAGGKESAPARTIDRMAVVKAGARLLPYAAAGTLLYLLIGAQQPAAAADVRNLLFFGAIVVAGAITPKVLATAAPFALVVLIVITSTSPLVRTRTFFGVIEVRQIDGYHAEYSGTTLHGLQYTDSRGAEPSAYYSRAGPLASVFDNLRSRTKGARIGVVGLGVGTIAAYARPGDEMTFYEIDPAVVDIARNPAYFTYLSNAAVTPRIVVGDARLSLEDQPSGSFDLLVLDAFSSDSVPAHLLTREAMRTYARTLRPGGVLAFHLSNRYYSLVGPVAATARSNGLSTLSLGSHVSVAQVEQFGATDSRWLIAAPGGDLRWFASAGWNGVTTGGLRSYGRLLRSHALAPAQRLLSGAGRSGNGVLNAGGRQLALRAALLRRLQHLVQNPFRVGCRRAGRCDCGRSSPPWYSRNPLGATARGSAELAVDSLWLNEVEWAYWNTQLNSQRRFSMVDIITERELLQQIRDLLQPISEVYRPQYEELMRTKKKAQVEGIIDKVGRGEKRLAAAKLMSGSRTRKEIAEASKIDSGELSRLIKALKDEGLVDEEDGRPRLVVVPTIVWNE